METGSPPVTIRTPNFFFFFVFCFICDTNQGTHFVSSGRDFMNGSPGSGRIPPGPGGEEGKWFQAIWERDVPQMKAAGVNTIRMYNTNPSTMLAVRMYPELFAPEVIFPINMHTGNEHVHFLDYVHQFVSSSFCCS
jgi:hypothetical protein